MNYRSKTLLVATLLACSVGTFAQSLSLKLNQVSVKQAMSQLKQKSGYSFVYEAKDLDTKKTVSVNASDLKQAITQILQSQDVSYTIQGKSIIIKKGRPAPSKTPQSSTTIKAVGKIVDHNGEPIIGATVSEVGGKAMTVTDLDGNYSLEVGENNLVAISYVGFTTETFTVDQLRNKEVVKLKEDSKSLGEVVVVGYGTQKKINLTGAVSQINASDIEDRPVANLSQMLQGAIPNLNINFSSGRPGSTGSLNIRGNTSINGGSPLVLIDGFEGNIDRINPDDVESVTVLKDASASAIYGARASFGVILVTTKKGKVGKSEISYSGRFSVSQPTTSTRFETRGYYSAKINDDFFRAYAGKNYTKYTEDDYYQLWIRRDDKTEHPDRPWVITDQRDGRPTYVYYANTDLYNYLYDNSRPTWEHNVSFSGGNETIRYKLSGSYLNERGIVRLQPDRFKKYTFNSSTTIQVRPWLQVSNSTRYYTSSYYFPGYSGINDLFDNAMYSALASFVPVNPDGTAVYQTSLMDYRYAEGRSALLINGFHHNTDIWDDFTTSFEMKLAITKNLSVTANYNFTKHRRTYEKRSDKLLSSKYPGELMERTDDIGLSRLTESSSDRKYHATNLFATYSQMFSRHHNFNAVVGMNYETMKIKDLLAQREGLLSTELNDFNLAKGDVMNITGGQNRYAIIGSFARINYDYAGKYLMELSGRYDGTSRFKRNERFGFFPSASVGWRISEEKFFTPLRSFIDHLKVRYSYGSLGNQQVVGYYDYLQTIDPSKVLNLSLGEGSKVGYAVVSAPNSAALTWEKVYTNNLGFDVTFFKQRLNITGDFYTRYTKGMLTKGKTLPAVYGAASPKANVADMKTNGWEISIGWKDKTNLAGKSLQYGISVGLSDYTSTITKYDNPTKLLSDYYEGMKLGDIWGYHIDGFFTSDEEAANYAVDQKAVNAIINVSAGSMKGVRAGDLKYVDLDGNNIISIGKNTADDPGDRTIIGNTQPRYSYGFNISASWNGFDVAAFFQGIGKQDWYPSPHSMAFWGPYSRPFASFIPRDFMDDVWSEDNPNAYYPRPRGYTAMATNRQLGAVNNRYMQDLAYCRLKNLTIGYSLPAPLLSKVGLTKVRIYFSGENLVTWTKLRSKYIDPEQATESKGTGKVYPWSKTYSFGLNITF